MVIAWLFPWNSFNKFGIHFLVFEEKERKMKQLSVFFFSFGLKKLEKLHHSSHKKST